ncbi:hypothetical protein EVU94_04775 [Flavobacteriaceae bacterium 144Ye]|nr:hypothetical protein EVU94_04775 [Flavobacteriaceae bacterium 144Ye]
MLKKALLLGILLVCFSCGSDDNYVSREIETSLDTASTQESVSVQIAIFENDGYIPEQGFLTITTASNGFVEILNNNTQTILDDLVVYTPSPNFTGQDTFTYTVCENENSSICVTETVSITVTSTSTVSFNLNEIPYQNLSEYGFFTGTLKDLNPSSGVVPYDLSSPLFSDYAHKKRFLWMPNNVSAQYVNDHSPFDFPVGTVLIKNFYYENVQPTNTTVLIETRLMYMTDEGWDFAKYVWNDQQTEATFTDDGSFKSIEWIENSQLKTVNYRIPSKNECFTCHNKFGTPLPIGPKPQNINKEYNYSEGLKNQLNKWIEVGYLENTIPSNIVSTVNWEDESLPLEIRARSYIDINCAHCHSDESYCEYRSMRFAFNENDNQENMGVCVDADTQVEGLTTIVTPNNFNESILHFRINSVQDQYRMPLLGRTLKHVEGVRLIEEWINSLNTDCQ